MQGEWSRLCGRMEQVLWMTKLYATDGIHFSRRGVRELSECLETVQSGKLDINRGEGGDKR